jgi:L-methionine (R)-S-oxide reductase
VHAFPGHIACDSASNSEIVIPLILGSELLGVLDLDSPEHARFGAADARGLEALAKIFLDSLEELRSTTENASEAPASVKRKSEESGR